MYCSRHVWTLKHVQGTQLQDAMFGLLDIGVPGYIMSLLSFFLGNTVEVYIDVHVMMYVT